MTSSTGLRLVHNLLALLTWLNILVLLLLAGVLVLTFAAEEQVRAALAETHPQEQIERLMTAVRLTMLIGIVVVPLAHLLLTRLRAIVATVAAGDPFVPDNAGRLTVIAWALLGIQLCDLGYGVMALTIARDADGFEWSFGLTGWLAVALLFVLASVFRHGTRMRDELAGTI